MIRRPPSSTRTANSFPSRRSSDLTGSIARFITRRFGLKKLPGLVECERAMIAAGGPPPGDLTAALKLGRSEEQTSELQSLMRSSYAVICLPKTNKPQENAFTRVLHRLVTSSSSYTHRDSVR